MRLKLREIVKLCDKENTLENNILGFLHSHGQEINTQKLVDIVEENKFDENIKSILEFDESCEWLVFHNNIYIVNYKHQEIIDTIFDLWKQEKLALEHQHIFCALHDGARIPSSMKIVDKIHDKYKKDVYYPTRVILNPK